jgi:hypothetical protein
MTFIFSILFHVCRGLFLEALTSKIERKIKQIRKTKEVRTLAKKHKK